MDGVKLGLQGAFAGGFFNAQGAISIAYDGSALYVTGSFGIGGASYTKGVALSGGITGEYFTGNVVNESANYYLMGIAGDGATAMAKASLPVDDLNNIDGVLPMADEISKMDLDLSIGGGVGGGAAVMMGVENETVLFKIEDTYIESINLNNQTGQCPADATNVNNIPVDDTIDDKKGSRKRN